ncbi:MAG: 16S rRNA (guanine(966)-N(2))-methyltransferase RsmD [Oligoflexia bacterium]|nr:16S rRNA (guanine(966)-N(2))-methyltransferase RsmD [Oligoflexia bacterium]
MISLSGGKWKGRKIRALDQEGLRPSSSRVKESIFHILESMRMKRGLDRSFEGWRVLDLFAGVGGLGIEALSRGADFCLFVEKNKRTFRTLKENLNTLAVMPNQALAICEDAFDSLAWSMGKKYHLILLDPPYVIKEEFSLEFLLKSDALEPGAIILWEHDTKWEPKASAPFRLLSHRKIGPAGVSLFEFSPN